MTSAAAPLIAGRGTPESAWAAAGIPRRWPRLDLRVLPRRAVLVAPHPDDEVLGVGGLLHLLDDAGVEVVVVAVTDGDASHPGSPTLGPAGLRRRRIAESAAALATLGLDVVPVRLALPDGGVAAHAARVTEALVPLLDPGDWCLATWRCDGHPDHEATGWAAAEAGRRSGARLLEYPVWAWHWAHPGDARLPVHRARRIPLPPAVRDAKAGAVAKFVTQVEPLSSARADAAILPRHVLDRLLREDETVFV